MDPLKVFKTGDLWMIVTLIQSILCRQSIHNKYFTEPGGSTYGSHSYRGCHAGESGWRSRETPSLSTGDEAECSLAICEHIKPSGTVCGSPALRNQKFCYYHSKVRKTVPKNNLFVFLENPGRKENDPYYAFEFPYLEDAAAVQIAFMQFIYGVSQHRMEEWRARMILSALHGAAANLRPVSYTH